MIKGIHYQVSIDTLDLHLIDIHTHSNDQHFGWHSINFSVNSWWIKSGISENSSVKYRTQVVLQELDLILSLYQAAEVSYEDLLGAKQLGFSDKQIAKCIRK